MRLRDFGVHFDFRIGGRVDIDVRVYIREWVGGVEVDVFWLCGEVGWDFMAETTSMHTTTNPT